MEDFKKELASEIDNKQDLKDQLEESKKDLKNATNISSRYKSEKDIVNNKQVQRAGSIKSAPATVTNDL